MPQVGRPRITTRTSARPPVNQRGVADPFAYGVTTLAPLSGGVPAWRQWFDSVEYVPELRWPLSLRTYNQMRSDSQAAALLTAMMWGISQLRYIIDPNGARPSLIQEISQDLNLPIKGKDDDPIGRMKRRFTHRKFISQALLSVLWGHMYFEQNGDVVDGKWRLRKMFPIMPQTIEQINVADDGGLVNIAQYRGTLQSDPLMRPELDVGRLTAFIFQQEGHSWVGRSMLRDIHRDWTLKDRLVRIEAINHERAGGVPYANAPEGATVDEISDLDQMMRQFRIGDSAGAALPFGAKLEIARGSGSDIDKTIRRYDESMARRFMMMVANLAQGGQHVGSYALGDIFNDLWHVGQRAIAQWYCDTVNEHVIEDIADWNYGEDEELVPKITWERTSEDSLGVDQLALLVQRGVIIVDDEVENAIRYKYQLPKRTGPRPAEVVGPGVPRQPPETPAQPAGAAPSGSAPSSVAASAGWLAGRIFKRHGSKVAASGPNLVTVPNVPILHTGVEYSLSTGPATFTFEDMRDAVMAANEDPSIPTPRLGLGHLDPRYNDDSLFDGSPSFGKATNLSLSENGTTVYADFVGVPAWLAPLLPYAFPSRSVEGYWNVTSQTGSKWRFVLTACKLLGIQWPGISVLEDLPQLPNYYGSEIPEDVVIDAALLAATGGDSVKNPFKKTAASANLDDVRRAFYTDFVPTKPEAVWWWIQAIYTDPNELVVEDDETGQLYKIEFSSDTEGSVSFGDEEAVRIEYVPDNRDAQKAAATHVAAMLAVGRKCLASWPTRDESVLEAQTRGGAMDPKEVRNRLGLPEDASDEQVRDALRELNDSVAPSSAAPEAHGGTTPAATGQPEPSADNAQPDPNPVATATAAAAGAFKAPPGTVLVDENAWAQVQAGLTRVTSIADKQEERERNMLVSAAMGDGRIPSASEEYWLNFLKTDPNAASVLAALKPNTVPIELRGGKGDGGTSEEGQPGSELTPELVGEWSSALFPEVRAAREAAEKGTPRPRVFADATYRR